jgi:nicotinamide-nucleotide amidase
MARGKGKALTAEILITGDELRNGDVSDTNGAVIARALERMGIRVERHTCIGDGMEAMTAAIREAAARASVLVVTGGLGPTLDDRTAEAMAAAAGVELGESSEALAGVSSFLASRGLELSRANRKQALLPGGAGLLPNPVGTAPGFHLAVGGCRCFCLPGVPGEMRVMLRERVVPALEDAFGLASGAGGVRVLSTFGLPESAVGERLEELEKRFPGVRLGLRVRFPEIDVRLYPQGAEAAGGAPDLDGAVEWAAGRLGGRVVSRSGMPLAAKLGRLLLDRKATLALAESCTGGLMAALLTDVPGSSGFFLFSGVTYANIAKSRILDVSEATLMRCGAVHEETAAEMAEGARRAVDADFGLSTTGIAGPDGGSEEKPVGTVCIGLAVRGGPPEAFRHVFRFADRHLNRRIFAATAFDRLRLRLAGGASPQR